MLSVLNRPEAEELTLSKVDLSPKTSAQHRAAPYGVFASQALGLTMVIPSDGGPLEQIEHILKFISP